MSLKLGLPVLVPCPCNPLPTASRKRRGADLLKVTEWLLVKKKKKTEEQRWQRGARLQLRLSKPPTPAPSRPQALLGWRASSPPRGLARLKEVHSRCSVSKIDGTHLFPFVPGDSPTQLVMTGSEGGTPPQALRKIVATKPSEK